MARNISRADIKRLLLDSQGSALLQGVVVGDWWARTRQRRVGAIISELAHIVADSRVERVELGRVAVLLELTISKLQPAIDSKEVR